MRKVFKHVICLTFSLLFFCSSFGCSNGSSVGKNTDNSFSMVATWTTSGLVNHYDSNTSCSAYDFFVVEGLYRYVRSTDEIFGQLAEGDPVHTKKNIADYKKEIGEDAYNYYTGLNKNTATITTVKIREGAKWQNGEDFTAKDVWAYYYTIHPTSSNYMVAVKVLDDKTIEFVWNPLKEPNDTVKELLIAQDKSGTVKYDEFASYVDPIYKIVMNSPVNQNPSLWGAFNRFSTNEQIVQINVIKNSFFSYSPAWYIATGPFKPTIFSATQILLEKNEHYWNAKNIGFEKVKLYSSSDLNQTYQLIQNDYVYYYDGFIQADTLESMLENNTDLVNLKMYDPGAIGIVFNLKNSALSLNVRKAFQYIFDRDEIKLSANPYATTSSYPLLGMAESEAKTYMSEGNFNNLTKYNKNHAEAEKLLIAEGWAKKNGSWYIGDKKVKFTLGAPSGHDISATAAEAAAAQLNSFGITIDLLKSSNFYSSALEENCPYDLMLEWTDLNMSFSYPTGSYNQFANIYSKWAHVERYPVDYHDTQKAGNVKLEFNGLGNDEKVYEFANYINSFYSINEIELKYLVDVFNTGLANMHLGVQFFQNVTASTINVGKIKGVPLEEYWSKDRNVKFVPQAGSQEFFDVAKTNLVYATNYMLAYGKYQPNNERTI